MRFESPQHRPNNETSPEDEGEIEISPEETGVLPVAPEYPEEAIPDPFKISEDRRREIREAMNRALEDNDDED